MASRLGAAAIFSLTDTGLTSRLVSKHRPDCPILAVTNSKLVARRLSMNWGVTPIRYLNLRDDQDKLKFAIEQALKLELVRLNDVVIVTSGFTQTTGGTNLIQVITIDDSIL